MATRLSAQPKMIAVGFWLGSSNAKQRQDEALVDTAKAQTATTSAAISALATSTPAPSKMTITNDPGPPATTTVETGPGEPASGDEEEGGATRVADKP